MPLTIKDWDSVVAGGGEFKRYKDLLADVRGDGKCHSITALVQPDDQEVTEVARILHEDKNFIEATQNFVNLFTTYKVEVGDYWRIPRETIEAAARYQEELKTHGGAVPPECDCDDKAILLCSILRNFLSADQVYCAFGLWTADGRTEGHMWVVTQGKDGQDLVIESTAGPEKNTRGVYVMHGMFNDLYAFSNEAGIKEFALKKVELDDELARR